MNTNTLLVILLIVAILGLLNSIRIEWNEKRHNDKEYAANKLRKFLSDSEAKDVNQANDTAISFTYDNTPCYLEWSNEPATTLYSAFTLSDSADIDKAREVASWVSSCCESISIGIQDNREIVIGCTTIVPDATSLMAVIPYMIGLISRALELMGERYRKETSQLSQEKSN